MEEEFRMQMYAEMMKHIFMRSDIFFVCRWCEGVNQDNITEQHRKEAYHNFYKRVKAGKIANRQTIQKWFGIGGKTLPRRGQLIDMAFVLGLGAEELNEYLQYAISEHGLQINDYEECIVWYCLEHEIARKHCDEMILFFEKHCDFQIHPRQTSRTEELLEQYKKIRKADEEEFLQWMYKNRDLFKGYSLQAYRCYQNIVSETLKYFRADVKVLLDRNLEEIGYLPDDTGDGTDEAEAIRRYLKNLLRRKICPVSKERVDEIRYLTSIVYAKKNRIKDYLNEIYQVSVSTGKDKNGMREALRDELKLADAKYVSELLNVAEQKQRMMNLKMKLSEKRASGKKVTAAEEKKYKVDNQRFRLIKRADLLIPLQYVAGKRYQSEITDDEHFYNRDEAKKMFVNMANNILALCDMREFDENYALDYVLSECYGEEEIYLLNEILEETE